MTPEQFQELTRGLPSSAKLHVDEVGRPERTLCFGYTSGRSSWHAYVQHGRLHVLVWRHRAGSLHVEDHHVGVELPLTLLRPDKRAYPERTDLLFAQLMADRGAPLTFAPFDEAQWRATDPTALFLAPVLVTA